MFASKFKRTQKMKKLFFTTVVAAIFALNLKAEAPAEGKTVYNVKTDESSVQWLSKKVTGQHEGTVSLLDGQVVAESNKLVSANLKLDMNTITCTDLTDEGWNQKLIGHLKSDDFFSVEKHPEVLFAATGFTPKNTDEKGNNYEISGKLTIKGITKDIAFPAKVKVADSKLTAVGVATVDRTEYDIKYKSGSFFSDLGDNMIYDDFQITFQLVATPGEAN